MSYSRLVESYNNLISDKHIIFEPIDHTFPTGNFNRLKLYNLPKVKYSYASHSGRTPEQELKVVHTEAGPNKTARRISRAYRTHRLFLQKQVPDTFNLTYLYSSDTGEIIAPYYPDGDLFEYTTNKGRLKANMADLKHLLAQIFLGIGNYHSKSLAHRDIKSENILITFINNKPYIKFADHDDVVEVNSSGKMLDQIDYSNWLEYMGALTFGTETYYSPELKKARATIAKAQTPEERRQIVENYNMLAEDCFQLGKLLQFLMYGYLNREDFKLIHSISNSRNFDESEHSQLACLYAALCTKAESRWTVNDVLNYEYFGETIEERNNYFNQIIKEAHRTMIIDNLPFYSTRIELEDTLYLQGADIKGICDNAYKILETIYCCLVSFEIKQNDFDKAVKVTEEVKSVENAIRQYEVTAKEIRRTKQNEEFFTALNQFEVDLNEENTKLNSKFYTDILPEFIYLTVDAAINEYSDRIRLNISRSDSYNSQHDYPLTLFQKFAYNDREHLKKCLKSANNSPCSLKIIKNYVGNDASYSESSFKSHLMTKLQAVLLKPLDELEHDLGSDCKRLRTS